MAKRPDLRLKRAYEAAGTQDGTRVLVDRLWPRGLAKEAAHVDLWLKEVAPSPELRRWFGHEPERFAGFAERYRAELRANPEPVTRLRELLAEGRVTLLYAAHDTDRNNAAVLAEYLTDGREKHHG